jgi:hypothetical protein
MATRAGNFDALIVEQVFGHRSLPSTSIPIEKVRKLSRKPYFAAVSPCEALTQSRPWKLGKSGALRWKCARINRLFLGRTDVVQLDQIDHPVFGRLPIQDHFSRPGEPYP